MGAYAGIPFQHSPLALQGREESDPDGRGLAPHLDHAPPPSADVLLLTYAWTVHLENYIPWKIGQTV